MSSSKYIPPNKRNNTTVESPRQPETFKYRYQRPSKLQWDIQQQEISKQKKLQQEENEKKKEFTLENFPTLGSLPTKVTVWDGNQSFADLAQKWQEKSQIDKIEKNQQTQDNYRLMYNAPLPRFHNIHRFVEQDNEEEDETEIVPNQDDGWTLVDNKKFNKKKTVDETFNRSPTPELENSVWDTDAPNEHETCWDERI